ncbi:hypothetical protein SI22_24825, partial [Salmonella enterica subsp. enterica serovar Kentucky]|nr:hypothetical protein [Salmonella enterica subsp. enterica serovar Kentucky]
MQPEGVISGDFSTESVFSQLCLQESELLSCNISGICVSGTECFQCVFIFFPCSNRRREAFSGFSALILIFFLLRAERVFVRCDFLVPFFDITSGWGIIDPLVSAPDGFVPEG